MAGKHHDLVNQTKKYKAELYDFFLDLKKWRAFRSRYRLDWQKVRFDEAGQADIPKQRGIYAFTAELSPAKLPAHGSAGRMEMAEMSQSCSLDGLGTGKRQCPLKIQERDLCAA